MDKNELMCRRRRRRRRRCGRRHFLQFLSGTSSDGMARLGNTFDEPIDTSASRRKLTTLHLLFNFESMDIEM